jgi:glycosyltransferase involved in cell wall biosynthesis
MLSSYPVLSVIMTCYNREQYIGEAIESVLAGGYEDFELLIVDDGSHDNTINIATKYAEVDERIRIYANGKNLGDYPNRNLGASYAAGEFIMFVDSDDKILPGGFASCIAAMQQFPNAGIGMLLKEDKGAAFYVEADQVIRRHFFQKPCLMIGPGGTILRRLFFKASGGYPVAYGPANDMYFNLKMACRGGIVFLPFTFNFYRIHAGQEINNEYSYLYNNYRYLRDALIELQLPLTSVEKEWIANKNKRRFLVNLVGYMIRTKNLSKTARALRKAGFGWQDARKAIWHPSL